MTDMSLTATPTIDTANQNLDGLSSLRLHTPKRSTTFYFDCVIFEVENVLYKIPRARLVEESESVFETMFTLPPEIGKTPEGEDDDHPIHLEQTKRKDWECLLRLLFPNPSTNIPDMTLDEWISVLELTTRWNMNTARTCAVEKIAQFDIPAKKIKLARDYRVPRYLIPSLVQLIGRSDPLTAQDFQDIGLECASKVVSLRERCYDPSHSNDQGTFRQHKVALDVSSQATTTWNAIVNEIHKTFKDHDEFYD